MPIELVVVTGDSHSSELRRIGHARKTGGFLFSPLGAVTQSFKPHHKIAPDGKSIELLEANWRLKQLPTESSHLGSASTLYAVSMPFNVFPLLRRIDLKAFTIDPLENRRAFLSEAAQEQLFIRRSRLSVTMLADMRKIGLRVLAVESPRPFSDAPVGDADPAMMIELSERYYRHTAEYLQKVGVPVLPQPAVTIENGFTKAVYRQEGDVQHGSPSLYALMLDDIISYASSVGD